MIRLLLRARSLTPNLSSESLRIKISVKTKLRSPPRKRLPRLRLRRPLRRRLPRLNCLKKRKKLAEAKEAAADAAAQADEGLPPELAPALNQRGSWNVRI